MKMIYKLFLTAIYTVFIQNFVFTHGFGMSEAIRVYTRKGTFYKFALIISAFSVSTCIICNLCDRLLLSSVQYFSIKAGIYSLILFIVYVISSLLLKFLFKVSEETLEVMGIAALNTLVLSIPFVNNMASYNLFQAIGSGIGAGFSFIFASALIYAGNNKLQKNSEIPKLFKGTPAMFIFVGILAMGFVGFS